MVLEDYPFTPKIMAVLLTKGFKQPIIVAYDGVKDPLDHLRTFVDLMRLYVMKFLTSQRFGCVRDDRQVSRK